MGMVDSTYSELCDERMSMAGSSQDSNLESSNASFDEKPIDSVATSEVAQSLLERRGNEIAPLFRRLKRQLRCVITLPSFYAW